LQDAIGQGTVDQAVYEQIAVGRVPGAPGMKYTHYAPQTPLTLVKGAATDLRDWLRRQPDSDTIGVLCFDDDEATFAGFPTVSYGPSDDAKAQAQRLFSALHQLDSLGVNHVYAQVASDATGVFLAVRNRLHKAAGYRVVDLTSVSRSVLS